MSVETTGVSQSQGRLVARGGAARAASYGASLLLSLISAPLLLRHLGVDRFGEYVTATALVATASLFADAGLTVLGMRDYGPLEPAGRRRLLAAILALRLGLALVGGAVAIGLAAVSGYPHAVRVGVAVAAAGMVLAMLQQTLTIPLITQLRQGTVAALELAAKALAVLGIVALVIGGAGLVWFLVIPLPVAAVMLLVTATAIRPELPRRTDARAPEIGVLMRQAAPIAAATITAALFYRVAVIVLSLTSTAQQTGYFAASLRLIEVVIPIPALLASVIFPVLAAAALADRARFTGLFVRLVDVLLVLGGMAGVATFSGAGLLIRLLGGASFAPAATVLRLQAPALLFTFLFAGWSAGLLVLRRQRDLVKATALGVSSVGLLTGFLAPAFGAQGAAVAMTLSEGVLAAAAGTLLLRHDSSLRPRRGFVAKVLAAILLPSAAVAVARLPDVLALVVATGASGFALTRVVPIADVRRLVRGVG